MRPRAQTAVPMEPRAHETFPDWLARLHLDQFTGPVLVHFLHGRPKCVEVFAECVRLDNAPSVKQT